MTTKNIFLFAPKLYNIVVGSKKHGLVLTCISGMNSTNLETLIVLAMNPFGKTIIPCIGWIQTKSISGGYRMKFNELTAEQLKSVIEGRSIAERVPMTYHFWTSPATYGKDEEKARILLDTYPNDISSIGIRMPDIFTAPEDDPEYRWVNYDDPNEGGVVALDSKCAIHDWGLLDGILDDFPDPEYKGMFPYKPADDGKYRLGTIWYCLFERLWSLRGMQNALTDFYTDPASVHRLFRALTDFYMRVMERGKEEMGLDGIFTSDDIGTQTGPFFSPAIFNEFFKPYYKELIDKAHSLGMHFWLHTCGNIEKFLPDFIEIGLDVIHPIQKYTMDEKAIAEKYGKDICIWAGFDVQRIIPYGTPDEVRKEVRFMIDTYLRPEGMLILTAGNAIREDCRVESLEALIDESYSYGIKKVASFSKL